MSKIKMESGRERWDNACLLEKIGLVIAAISIVPIVYVIGFIAWVLGGCKGRLF